MLMEKKLWWQVLCYIYIYIVFVLNARTSYYSSRICVPNIGDHKKDILNDCLDIPISCHSGFFKTYGEMNKYYFWLGLKKDVRNYVK